MPIVFVTRDPMALEDKYMPTLTSYLLHAVIDNLNVPNSIGYKLNEDNVSIRVHDKGSFDKMTHSVEILVLAGMHPERKKNCKERERNIQKAMGNYFKMHPGPTINFFVWVVLAEGAFGEGLVEYAERGAT